MGKSKLQLYLALSSYLVGSLSSGIFTFILSLYILRLTGSSLAFSVILLLEPMALLVSSPFVGSVVDRAERKCVVIWAQSVSIGVVLVAIAAFSFVSTTQFQLIMAAFLVFCLTLCDNFQKVAYKAATVNLVEKTDYQRLIAGEQTVVALMMLLAPILGGILFPLLSLTQAMVVEIFGEALVLVLLAKLSFNAFGEKFVSSADNKRGRGFLLGLTYIGQDKILVALLLFGVLANLALSALIIGEPIVLLQQYHVSPKIYGGVEACLALGMILGSVLMEIFAVKGDKCSYTAKVGLLITVVFLMLALISFSDHRLWIIVIFAIGLGLLGIAICLANTPYMLHMRTKVDLKHQGRINATADAITSIALPVGLGLFGLLFNYFPAGLIFFGAGIVVLVASLWLAQQGNI
ncbi:MFS transporter [Lactobacillus sp. AN1001]